MARKYSISKIAPKKRPYYCIDGPWATHTLWLTSIPTLHIDVSIEQGFERVNGRYVRATNGYLKWESSK
jgi:hypothetical protein